MFDVTSTKRLAVSQVNLKLVTEEAEAQIFNRIMNIQLCKEQTL